MKIICKNFLLLFVLLLWAVECSGFATFSSMGKWWALRGISFFSVSRRGFLHRFLVGHSFLKHFKLSLLCFLSWL